MQKKTTLNKKNAPIEEKTDKVQSEKKKAFSKSLSFFAVFVICIGAAALYPYLTQEQPISVPHSINYEDFEITEPKFVQEEEEKKEQPVIQIAEQADCSAKEENILSQQKVIEGLQEKVHQLELENLNLKEQTSSSEKATLLSVRLLNEIHTGQPFDTTLKELLKHNPADSFALTVREKLGDYASVGIATPEKLEKLFYLQMTTVQDSFYASKPNASWNQKLTKFFKSLFHIYPQNVTELDTKPENLLFLARKQVEVGQFTQAVNTIKRLPDSSQQFFKNFVQNTLRYVEAQEIIDAYTLKGNKDD